MLPKGTLIHPKKLTDDQDQQQRRNEHLVALNTKLKHVQELKQSAGWQEFIKEQQNEEIVILSKLENSMDPTTLAKLTGSLLVVKWSIRWTDLVIKEIEEALNER